MEDVNTTVMINLVLTVTVPVELDIGRLERYIVKILMSVTIIMVDVDITVPTLLVATIVHVGQVIG
jgi:hypothetical protein